MWISRKTFNRLVRKITEMEKECARHCKETRFYATRAADCANESAVYRQEMEEMHSYVKDSNLIIRLKGQARRATEEAKRAIHALSAESEK